MVIGFSIQYLIACCCCLFSDKKNKFMYIKENTNMSLLCEMSRERERGRGFLSATTTTTRCVCVWYWYKTVGMRQCTKYSSKMALNLLGHLKCYVDIRRRKNKTLAKDEPTTAQQQTWYSSNIHIYVCVCLCVHVQKKACQYIPHKCPSIYITSILYIFLWDEAKMPPE